MKISNNTIEVLKNFAAINSNIIFLPGQDLKTINEAKSILGIAKIQEDFPKEFGIYDLNEFLSVISLVGNPSLEFKDSSVYLQADEADRYLGSVEYYFSSKDTLTTPPSKEISMDSKFSIEISEESLNQIKKAAAILGHRELAIAGEDGVITAKILDDKDITANVFELKLAHDNDCKNKFKFIIHISSILKLFPGDYYTSFAKEGVSYWQNSDHPINYFIAVEKTSEYHV